MSEAAAEHINAAYAEALARGKAAKPPVIRGQMTMKELVAYQRATRRCSVKWVKDQIKDEVKGDDVEE